MAIFGKYQGGDPFNVAGNMQGILKGQQAIHDSMMSAVEKFNTARQEMDQLQATTGSILSQYKVDEKGNPDPTAPKYVHDLFKAVNKEGGLANMSRSQMLAGIKAYEVGYGIEQQRLKAESDQLALEGARTTEAVRKIQLEQAQMGIEDIRRARAEQERIRKAAEAVKGDVDKISKTKTITGKETKTFEIQGQKLNFTSDELSPLLAVLNNEKASPEEKENAKRGIEKLIYAKSRYSQKEIDAVDGAVWNPDTLMHEPVEKNPLFKDFKSVYDKLPEGPRELIAGPDGKPAYKDIKSPTFTRRDIDAFINAESRKFAEVERKKTELQQDESLPADVARYALQKTEPFISHHYSDSPVYNDKELSDLEGNISNIKSAISVAEDEIKEGGAMSYGAMGIHRVPLNQKELLERRSNLVKLKNKLKTAETKFNARKSSLEKAAGVAEKQQKEGIQYTAGTFDTGTDYYNKETEVVREVRKSVEEQTDDEYNLMMNYFRSTEGGTPLSFTKDAFYAMKGIVRPMVQDLGIGSAYVRLPSGKEEIVKINQDGMGGMTSSKLSLRDQKLLFEAQQTALQRNMNGLEANGYRFSGELRVGDIDTANKVRDGVLKSTRALQAVDRMIQIGENASLFDKLLPTEISGIAQSLTNAAQAANRTEIGGSGSWSNQDQVYMDKVIRDPSGGFNAIFSTQTIASLKEYRRRLEQSLVDSGNVYGFAFERAGEGGQDNALNAFRMKFHINLARGMSQEEALSAARAELDANLE